MASAKSGATLTTWKWPDPVDSGLSGMVSVTTTFFSGLSTILSTAGPLRTGCVATA